MERIQGNEFFKRIGQVAHVLQEPGHLLFLGMNMWRQKAAQSEGLALDFGKSSPFVAQWIVQ